MLHTLFGIVDRPRNLLNISSSDLRWQRSVQDRIMVAAKSQNSRELTPRQNILHFT